VEEAELLAFTVRVKDCEELVCAESRT